MDINKIREMNDPRLFATTYRRKYDSEGYDQEGYDKRGFDRDGNFATGGKYDFRGLDKDGYDKNGFGKKRINGFFKIVHRETMTELNPEGYDHLGYDKDGFDKDGYNKYGRNKQGLNKRGFDRERYHYITGTKFDLEGYDFEGYDKRGFKQKSSDGLSINKYTGTKYDEHGFDGNGVHNITGTKYDLRGFDCFGINKNTGTIYDEEGFDFNDRDKTGYSRENALDRSRQYAIILRNINDLVNDRMSIERYKAISSITIETLLYIAYQSKLSSEVKSKLRKKAKEYEKLNMHSKLKDLCSDTSFIIDDKKIELKNYYSFLKTTFIFYLKRNDIYICDYTIKKYIKLYIQGKLDLTKSIDENLAEIEKQKQIEQENNKHIEEKKKKLLKIMNKVNKIKENM